MAQDSGNPRAADFFRWFRQPDGRRKAGTEEHEPEGAVMATRAEAYAEIEEQLDRLEESGAYDPGFDLLRIVDEPGEFLYVLWNDPGKPEIIASYSPDEPTNGGCHVRRS